ncbi:MAG TPA: CDC27 family protein, partial [Planctomycetota bacterium]|nr:CDC27 family protein [Planctomycetota bacterium]
MTRGGILVVAALAACSGSPRPAARPSLDAQAHFLAGNYRAALAAFESEGGGASARLHVALCLLKLDRPGDAVAALQAMAGSVQPHDVTLRIQLALAEAHAMAGDATASLRAAQAAERAADRRPGSVARDEFLFV